MSSFTESATGSDRHGTRRTIAFVIALAVFALDRWSKWLVETQFNAYDTRTVIPGFFNIVRSENPGVAFGILSESPTHSRTMVLAAFSLIALVLLAAMLWRIDRLDTASATGLALIFGGAMGNVFDRIRVGRVTDFLDFSFGSYHWYTFNLADASICIGAGLLILSMVFAQRHPARV
jgi:signal peptidase II